MKNSAIGFVFARRVVRASRVWLPNPFATTNEWDEGARAIGAPFVPVTPTFPWLGLLGLIPLPSKWRIEFCDPIDLSEHGPDAAADRRLLFDISEQVRETIQEALYQNLVKRGSAFL